MRDESAFIKALRWFGTLLPGDYLKTAFYLNVIAKPRKALRLGLHSFYRLEHVYDVLLEAKRHYAGRFSVLEFGTADGYAFTKMLYATRYLGMQERVTVHGFDTFEGLPAAADRKDLDIVTGERWKEGAFRGRYEELDAYCQARYPNYQLHRGFFHETLTDELLASLLDAPPILVWIDCDYYSSTRAAMERLIPYLPNGCVVYFDDIDINFGSRFTGEARFAHELNQGVFGEGIELILDPQLSLHSRRVHRFIRFESDLQYELLARGSEPRPARLRSNDSALP